MKMEVKDKEVKVTLPSGAVVFVEESHKIAVVSVLPNGEDDYSRRISIHSFVSEKGTKSDSVHIKPNNGIPTKIFVENYSDRETVVTGVEQ